AAPLRARRLASAATPPSPARKEGDRAGRRALTPPPPPFGWSPSPATRWRIRTLRRTWTVLGSSPVAKPRGRGPTRRVVEGASTRAGSHMRWPCPSAVEHPRVAAIAAAWPLHRGNAALEDHGLIGGD